MTKAPKKNGRNSDGTFAQGNALGGKTKGARHRVTLAVEALLEGEAEALTRKAVEKALDGDMTALRLCMDRICPPRKERPVSVSVPKVDTAQGAVEAIAEILEAVASGEILPSEGQALAAMIETQRRTLETEDIERRLAELEKRQAEK